MPRYRLRNLSAVDVAASASAVHLRPDLSFKLHEAPDIAAVSRNVRLDASRQLLDGGQVEAQQLRALLRRRRDRPARSGSSQVPTATDYRTEVRESSQTGGRNLPA
jgi:hypothetical protein